MSLRRHSSASNATTQDSLQSRQVSRISFRPRPIDVAKPLPIVWTEIEDDETQRSVPIMPTGMESNEESELHIQEIIQASMKMRHEDLPEIPIPVVKVVDGYDTAENPHPYHMGSTYVLYKMLNDDELNLTTEYDLDSDDEHFVSTLNQGAGASETNAAANKRGHAANSALTLDRFETIIDKFEKELYNHGQCDVAKAEQICKGMKPNVAQALHTYWMEKRKTRSTLIRRLLRPPDREDPSPYKAFRPREVELKQKKARKNDQASFNKMNTLRQEFERARTLLEMLKKRERLKKDHFAVVQQIYSKLRELAQVKLLEPEENLVSSPPTQPRKKKDRATAEDREAAEAEETSSVVVGLPHNYPGPVFVNKEQQPLIIGNGKARQEGYRHFICKPGQFPSPTLEKIYSNEMNSSPSIKTESMDELDRMESEQSSHDRLEQQLIREKEEAAARYYNSMAVPTSSEYYADDEDDEGSSDEQVVSNANGRTTIRVQRSARYQPSLNGGKRPPVNVNPYSSAHYSLQLQPKMDGQGKPIYPSVNNGCLFIGPNLPPVFGRARVGLYGATYIDIVPVDKELRIKYLKQQKQLQEQQEQQRQQHLQQHRQQLQQQQQQVGQHGNDNSGSGGNISSSNINSNSKDSNNITQSSPSTSTSSTSNNASQSQSQTQTQSIIDIDIVNPPTSSSDLPQASAPAPAHHSQAKDTSSNNNIPMINVDIMPSSTIHASQSPSPNTPSTHTVLDSDRTPNQAHKRKTEQHGDVTQSSYADCNTSFDKMTKITDYNNFITKNPQANGHQAGSSSFGHGGDSSVQQHNGGDGGGVVAHTTPSSVTLSSPLSQKKLKTTHGTPNNKHSSNNNKKHTKSPSSSSTFQIDQYLTKKVHTTPTIM
ncbi:hypothetical protein SAMD00019534_081170 [Acytostelium subglobosum LB1]|uniref:hypothetical protein n=1 Tax=Acytostelium subglobosum LB1 TaxID=1410327 RepID=UPI000644A60F|nr:hypothetical protein SAMD00019534_081170 [Acytostelium subglobosum LB1]GAM24942.1 hypothetical protein SAMD00019534_081170 [Acytostelium subglobosum LB1]|eukprot:XP_012752031.1 hypothetical protein SAMD00019534_081170 [Acytostelium subglobosum LB1]